MASTILGAPPSSSSFPIDMSFDLDEALTLLPPPPQPDPRALAALADLPAVDAAKTPEVCSVCMEGFRAGGGGGGGKRVPCGHVYHQGCIAEWSLRHNSCPLCRSKIFQLSS